MENIMKRPVSPTRISVTVINKLKYLSYLTLLINFAFLPSCKGKHVRNVVPPC